MGKHTVVTVERGGAYKPRPGVEMRQTVTRMQADREMRDGWVRATNGVPGRASNRMRSVRCGRHNMWAPEFDEIDETLTRAEELGDPNAVWATADELLTTTDVRRNYIISRRDEALARIARNQRPTPPSAAALRRAA